MEESVATETEVKVLELMILLLVVVEAVEIAVSTYDLVDTSWAFTGLFAYIV
jgi:hypothetical protein